MRWLAVIVHGHYSGTQMWYVGTFEDQAAADAHCQRLVAVLRLLCAEIAAAPGWDEEMKVAIKIRDLMDPGGNAEDYNFWSDDFRWCVGPVDRTWRIGE